MYFCRKFCSLLCILDFLWSFSYPDHKMCLSCWFLQIFQLAEASTTATLECAVRKMIYSRMRKMCYLEQYTRLPTDSEILENEKTKTALQVYLRLTLHGTFMRWVEVRVLRDYGRSQTFPLNRKRRGWSNNQV